MSMNSYFTLGFGFSGPGLTDLQQKWYDDENYDLLDGSVLPGHPGVDFGASRGELGNVWFIFVPGTEVHFDFRGDMYPDGFLSAHTELPGQVTKITEPINAAYHELFGTLPPAPRWHLLHQIL